MPKINPLSEAQLDNMQMVVNTTQDVLEFCRALEDCGLPVSDKVDSANGQCKFCRAVIRNFFPDYQQ